MLAKWTGKVIGEMHVTGVTMRELAAEIGWHEKYLSAVLNGHRNPKEAESKIKEGLSRCKDRIKNGVQ